MHAIHVELAPNTICILTSLTIDLAQALPQRGQMDCSARSDPTHDKPWSRTPAKDRLGHDPEMGCRPADETPTP